MAKEAFDLIAYITKGDYDKKLADESIGIPSDTTNSEWPEMVSSQNLLLNRPQHALPGQRGVETNVDITPVLKRTSLN